MPVSQASAASQQRLPWCRKEVYGKCAQSAHTGLTDGVQLVWVLVSSIVLTVSKYITHAFIVCAGIAKYQKLAWLRVFR